MTEGSPEETPRLRLCRIVTVPQTFQTLLREQLRCIVAHGIDLTMVCSPGPELAGVQSEIGAPAATIAIARQPSPWSDLRSLAAVTRFLRRNRFDIVHSSTPKAGLLAALAGRLAGVPIRLHTFTGQPWVELTGLRRRIPRACDRITAALATHCYADSPSQRDFLVSEGLVAGAKISVLGPGSISGVDLKRFSSAVWGGAAAQATRQELRIPADALVVVFVGRVTKDKGVNELVSAFELFAQQDPAAHLVVVGPFEPERDPLPEATLRRLREHPRLRCVGFTATPEKYLAAGDIFCLPSYREGFGSVVIEAAALALPAIVTRITGLVDTVVEGETGLVVPAKTVEPLVAAFARLAGSRELRLAMGGAARRRAEASFSAEVVNAAVVGEYFRHASVLPGRSSQKRGRRC